MIFLQENLSRFAVMICLNVHCVSDIACADNAAALLVRPTIKGPFHKVDDITNDAKGCYL